MSDYDKILEVLHLARYEGSIRNHCDLSTLAEKLVEVIGDTEEALIADLVSEMSAKDKRIESLERKAAAFEREKRDLTAINHAL